MTLYGWDTSHYDGEITADTARQAKAEGIVFATAKVGEGNSYNDPLDSVNLAAFRDAGIEFLGGYYVVRSGAVMPQVDNCLALAYRDIPWWPDHSGWFWQVDLEHWTYDAVPAATGIAFGRQLRERTKRQVVMYASHGQYFDELRGWDGPLWNADYTSRPAGGFVAMYPGDDWAPLHKEWRGGWTAYSGQTPAFLQYTSQAIIAGHMTCDANAFRGTLAQLRELLTGQTNGGGDMLLYKIKGQEAVYEQRGGYRHHIGPDLFQTLMDAKAATLIEVADEAELLDAVGPEKPKAEELDLTAVRVIVREELDKTKLAG